MSEPIIAQKSPFPVEVEASKSYFLVCMREKCQTALLRWQPQGH